MKYIELNSFLKIKNLASSGGDAKQLIRSEQIKVNGEIETRIRKKLISGDTITYQDKEYLVTKEITLMESETKSS